MLMNVSHLVIKLVELKRGRKSLKDTLSGILHIMFNKTYNSPHLFNKKVRNFERKDR